MKEIKVTAIKEGTVLDHLPGKTAFKISEILSLGEVDNLVVIATNLKSKSRNKKDIIKVEGKVLNKHEVNKIAIIAPKATMNIIKDYNVKEKMKLELPEVIEGIVKCNNPKCITNNEEVTTKFYTILEKPLRVRCHHCERYMEGEEVKLL